MKTIIALVLIVLFVVACNTLRDKPSVGRTPSTVTRDYPMLTFEKLLEIAKKQPTIEGTLKALEAYPDYLSNHTYMYDSFSLQRGSFEEPRAIVFGPEAKFVFTFNGKPGVDGGSSLETVQFDEPTKHFLYREIALKNEISNDDRRVHRREH